MVRTGIALMGLAAVLAVTPAGAAEIVKHSGTIGRIDPAGKTLTLQEMGPWTGPGTRLVTRTITLTPDTRGELVRRPAKAVPGGWSGGYVESPLAVDRLRPGEFATVTVDRRGGKSVAVAIDVVRPSERSGRPS